MKKLTLILLILLLMTSSCKEEVRYSEETLAQLRLYKNQVENTTREFEKDVIAEGNRGFDIEVLGRLKKTLRASENLWLFAEGKIGIKELRNSIHQLKNNGSTRI